MKRGECVQCSYWVDSLCHRFPPAADADGTHAALTPENHWCGEFIDRQQAREFLAPEYTEDQCQGCGADKPSAIGERWDHAPGCEKAAG